MSNLLLILLLSRANLNFGSIAPLLFNQMGSSQNNIQSQVMGMLRNRMGINSPMSNVMGGMGNNLIGSMLGNRIMGNMANKAVSNTNTPMPMNSNFFDNMNKTLSGMDPSKKTELLNLAKSVFKN